MAQVDPARRAMMKELADWRAEWARKWGIDDMFYDGDTFESWEGRIPPEAEADLRQRSDEIMARHRAAAKATPSDPTPAGDGSAAWPSTTATRPLPAPRSRDEAMFYMNERPCPRCGRFRTNWSASLVEVDGRLARRYAGECGDCGQPREFVFELAEHTTPRPAGATVWYGGDEPSRLFDAGQWLAMSEQAAQFARDARARNDTAGYTRDAELALAFAAEAGKFVPPGTESVPDSAFWTDVGRGMRAADPSRFTRRRLTMWLQMLAEEFPEAPAAAPAASPRAAAPAPGVRSPVDPAPDPSSLPLGRTSAEIHLYLDMRPCECGEAAFNPSGRLEDVGGVPVARYEGRCQRCGIQRSFAFRLPVEHIASGGEGAQFRYGDERPSELLDPGEWLLAADALSRSVPALSPGAGQEERKRFRYAIGRAAAAVDEVTKFVAPGADAVPPEAFTSERGRALYATEPGRFRLVRLDAVREAYRRLLAEAGLP